MSPVLGNRLSLINDPASIVAVGKPVIAKVADVSSRGSAYVGVREYMLLNPTVTPNGTS